MVLRKIYISWTHKRRIVMTPKQKAKELFDNYLIYFPEFRNDKEWDYNEDKTKQCALIAVEIVILNCYEEEEYYWQEVKQEIEKL